MRPIHWTRRRLLSFLALLPAGIAASCAKPSLGGGAASALRHRRLIDSHCHIFNITDLPAASFTQRVLLSQYAHVGQPSIPEQILARALKSIERLLSSGVPSAAQEASLPPGAALSSLAAGRLSGADERLLSKSVADAEDALPPEDNEFAAQSCESGLSARPSVKTVSNWLQGLRSYRASQAQDLVESHSKSGFSPSLICPALVDYSNWLDQSLRSPLPDQVRAAGKIACDPSLPAVHGYVAFDPLRRALVREGLPVVDGRWDPLALVRDALVNHGFIGIKLYPPMGFRASNNAAANLEYPPHVVAAFGGPKKVAAQLDRSLDELWALCEELDAPIIAHAANSNAAGKRYARRADPSFWAPVLAKHPSLRVMLAHFGRFRSFSAGQLPICEQGDVPLLKTWEAVVGRLLVQNPAMMLFADVSYYADLFDQPDRARALGRMKSYLAMDPGARHLVFGSDWAMTAIESGYAKAGGYPRRIADFLSDAGLGDGEIANVMYGNAVRFLGIAQGSKTRQRILGFYKRCGLPEARLPS